MRLDFTPRRLFFPDQVTILNLTPEQAAKLAENQAKFNAEISKTEDLLENVEGIIGDDGITGKLKDALKNARGLNTEYGRGEDIANKLKKASNENAKKLEELQYQRNRNLATLSKAEALEANRKLDAQIKVLEGIDTQIRFLQASLEEEKRITEELKKQNSLGGVLKKTLKDAIKPFAELFSAAGIFKAIIDSALRFSKISTDIGKSLGYGSDKANEVTSNMVEAANASNNVNMTLANMGEAASQLSESTGLVAKYSSDALETQIMLTKQFGLTGEEAAGIYKFSLLTGKSSEQVNDEMVGAFVAARNASKAGIPFKQTMAEAAKVSGALASNLQNNPTAIVKAVVATKSLGSSLEQASKQGEALLDFESSLENELKAELLTGKQLNLERARAAALAGDQVTVAEELNKQVGSLEEFDRMNVLQKKSIAAAVGLTTDELAEQLRKQRQAIKNGESLEQLTKREALEAEQRQATQDKFNAAVLKLQDFFGNLVAGPLGQFLEILTNSLPLIKGIGVAMGVWYTISKGIALYNLIMEGSLLKQIGKLPALLGMKSAQAALETEIAVAGISAASAFTLGIGAIAIIAGIIAAVAAMKSQKAGDMISPADGKTMVSTKEGGLFELSKNDDLLAGPGLAEGGGGGGGSMDLTPMIAAINEVKAAVNQLMNRPVIVNMDGKQVGSSLVQASPKSA